MSTDLFEQLRIYGEDFASIEPVTLDQVAARMAPVEHVLPATTPRRVRGWVYAVAAAAISLVLGIGMLLLATMQDVPPIQSTTTVSTTTVSTTTTNAPPDTTTTTVSGPSEVVPPGRLWPAMVDRPEQAGVIMLGGNTIYGFPDVWSFRPDTGWEALPPAEGLPRFVEFLGYDPTTALLWVSEYATEDEFWTYAPRTDEWTRINTAGGPSGNDSAAALDVESRRLIYWSGTVYGETWETWAFDLDEHAWSLMNPGGPTGRISAMIYDPESDRVVLFGGQIWSEDGMVAELLGDTWVYDFNSDSWTNMDPLSSPPPSSVGSMVYDPVTDRVILFGGQVVHSQQVGWQTIMRSLDTTWTYDFNTNTWTQLDTASAPSRRHGASMAYDRETGIIVLFGGSEDWENQPDDTWLFDPVAETWTEWTPEG